MGDAPRFSRREFVALAAASAALPGALGSVVARAAEPATAPPTPHPATGKILHELLAGNERFATGRSASPRRGPEAFRASAEGQRPVAIILGCADSRVPPELVFDTGVGDLFIVRVAGNVVGGTGVVVPGSIEYAVAELGVPLILVLGHSGCGAVKAAVQHIDAKDSLPGAINGLVELVKPAVAQSRGEPGDALENAIRENVILGVERLEAQGPILAPRVADGSLMIAGGVYDLRSGRVALVSRPG